MRWFRLQYIDVPLRYFRAYLLVPRACDSAVVRWRIERLLAPILLRFIGSTI